MMNKFASSKDFTSLNKKFDEVLVLLEKKFDSQIVKSLHIPETVVFESLKSQLEEMFAELKNAVAENKPFEHLSVSLNQKPKWWKDAPDTVSIKSLPAVEVKNVVRVKGDNTDVVSALAIFFSNLVSFLSKSMSKTFAIMPLKEHYTTPQMMMLIDPKTMKPISPQDIGIGTIQQNITQGIASGPRNVGVRGANTINDGTTSVTTAGTRVQLPTVACSRVYVQAAPGNTGDIVIGGENVIASAGTRRGLALFSSQWQAFEVDNLNRLFIDSTADGDKINYIYEYFA